MFEYVPRIHVLALMLQCWEMEPTGRSLDMSEFSLLWDRINYHKSRLLQSKATPCALHLWHVPTCPPTFCHESK